MKNPLNKIDPGSQFTRGIEGYVFDGADGSRWLMWTNPVADIPENTLMIR